MAACGCVFAAATECGSYASAWRLRDQHNYFSEEIWVIITVSEGGMLTALQGMNNTAISNGQPHGKCWSAVGRKVTRGGWVVRGGAHVGNSSTREGCVFPCRGALSLALSARVHPPRLLSVCCTLPLWDAVAHVDEQESALYWGCLLLSLPYQASRP